MQADDGAGENDGDLIAALGGGQGVGFRLGAQ